MKIDLAEMTLPDFGRPVSEPFIPDEEYDARIAAARELMRRKSLDALVIYGDREHFANLAYLTGYDPRFEEALCVLTAEGNPTLIVGNEGPGYARLSPVALNVVLYQTFSLLGQPRDQLVPLRYGNPYCEGCKRTLIPGERVLWARVQKRRGVTRTIYCADCAEQRHAAKVRA